MLVREVDPRVGWMGLGFDRGCAGRAVDASGGRFDCDDLVEGLLAGEVMDGDGRVLGAQCGTAMDAGGDRGSDLRGCVGGAVEAVHDASSRVGRLVGAE